MKPPSPPSSLLLSLIHTSCPTGGSAAAAANISAAQLNLCVSQPSSAPAAHAHMITSGLGPRSYALNRLIDVYAKSGKLKDACRVFDRIPQPDVVARTTLINAYSHASDVKLAWAIFEATPLSMRDVVIYNAMISGYARNGDGWAAVELFVDMKRGDVCPDHYTFTSVLSGLGLIVENDDQCHQFHCVVLKAGMKSIVSVANALVSVYMKCPTWLSLDPGRRLFDEMHYRNELTWTTLISGYARRGELDVAKDIFDEIDEKVDAAWNAMISGYVQHGYLLEALDMFKKMLVAEITLDEFTFSSLLSGCANAGFTEFGKQVHAHILRTNPVPEFERSLPLKNALITLYAKSGSIVTAERVFKELPVRSLVSWNAILSAYVSAGWINDARKMFEIMGKKNLLTWTVIISGLAQSGCEEEALKLFSHMRKEGINPCDYTFAGAFAACAGLGALEHGRELHSQLIKCGFESSLSANNALVTMYARCGVLEAAHTVFLTMTNLDSVSWNTIISALGQHGHGIKAIDLFELMLKENMIPDRITFRKVLSACSHGGLIEEGNRYFQLMKNVYGINPGQDHVACLIDLLGRAGRILEAERVIETIPFEPDAQVWEALLSGCVIHGNMEVGIRAAERLLELTPHRDGTYVLLSNMYAAVGRWGDVARVREVMKKQGVKKEPGCSWIEVANKVHMFLG